MTTSEHSARIAAAAALLDTVYELVRRENMESEREAFAFHLDVTNEFRMKPMRQVGVQMLSISIDHACRPSPTTIQRRNEAGFPRSSLLGHIRTRRKQQAL